jgi:hypothetical protein
MATAKKTKAKPVKAEAKPGVKKPAPKKPKSEQVPANESDPSANPDDPSSIAAVVEPLKAIPVEAWSELAVGHLVLAWDKKAQGFFDASIEAVVDGMVVLRWHDYDENTAEFTRKLEQVALKHPAMVKPC